jgi:hypothetical protein
MFNLKGLSWVSTNSLLDPRYADEHDDTWSFKQEKQLPKANKEEYISNLARELVDRLQLH